MMDDLINIIRREAAYVLHAFQLGNMPMTVTGYNPTDHTIRGMLRPSGIETGWIPIVTPHASNNAGFLIGPVPGDANTGEGADVFNVVFDAGDPNTMRATHRLFSDQDKPPVVQSGEVLAQHSGGTRLFMDMDGQLICDRPDGSKMILKKNGDAVITPKPGGMLYSGGDPDDGGTFSFVMTVDGPSTTHKAKVG